MADHHIGNRLDCPNRAVPSDVDLKLSNLERAFRRPAGKRQDESHTVMLIAEAEIAHVEQRVLDKFFYGLLTVMVGDDPGLKPGDGCHPLLATAFAILAVERMQFFCLIECREGVIELAKA